MQRAGRRDSSWRNQSGTVLECGAERFQGCSRAWDGDGGTGAASFLHGHVVADEQLVPAGPGLQAQEGAVDEQHLQAVLGELGSPCHVQPRPQQLWGGRDSLVTAAGLAGGTLGFPPCPQNASCCSLLYLQHKVKLLQMNWEGGRKK